MPARLIKANVPQYESGYVHMPLDFINEDLAAKQQNFDTTSAAYENVVAKPIGLENIQDELQQNIAIGDYQKAVDWASKFNSGVDEAVDNFYKTGDINAGARGIAKLQKELQLANSQEGILGRNKARMEAYQKLNEGLAKVKNLPNSYHRSIPYLREIEKIQSDPNYIPTTDVAYADHVDRVKVADDVIKGMETYKTAYANPDYRGGKYISEGTHEFRTSKDIGDAYDFAFQQSGLFDDIAMEVDYLISKGQITTQEQAQDYFDKKTNELKEFVKTKYTTDKRTTNLSTNAYGVAGYEYDLNNPSLPIISEHGATGVTKGSTFNDWKKSLTTKNEELKNASQNTVNNGLQLIQAAGITDKNTVDYIARHRDEFYNPDGSLNLNAVQQVAGKQLTGQDITNLQSGFAFYNEAYKQEKDIERQRDNMQVRVDNIIQNFKKQYGNTELGKVFDKNKDYLSQVGVFNIDQLVDYVTKNPEAASGVSIGDQGDVVYIPGLDAAAAIINKDLDIYFENNSFANSYLTLENAANNRGVGIYNKGITDHFKKDPVALLNSRVDGTTMLVKDYLKKNGINPDQINLDNLSISMIGNSMLDGGTGMMVSIKDGKGKKLAELPVSDDGIQSGSRDQILNQSYYDLMVNPSPSNPSNQQYSDALELSKGNLVAGKELRQIDTRNMQPNESNTIKTNSGVPYTITKLPLGGYTVTVYGSGGKAYQSNPEQPLVDDNAILQFIGNIEFSKNSLQLQK